MRPLRECPSCLRILLMSRDDEICGACERIRMVTEPTDKDIQFLRATILRHVTKYLGYWPPRWAYSDGRKSAPSGFSVLKMGDK